MQNFICVEKDAQEAKKCASYENPTEMNTVEN